MHRGRRVAYATPPSASGVHASGSKYSNTVGDAAFSSLAVSGKQLSIKLRAMSCLRLAQHGEELVKVA
jgi:hypothetical protein